MDQYKYQDGSGKTSVKVHHQPGGNSSFSLGWGNDNVPQQSGKANVQGYNVGNQSQQHQNQIADRHDFQQPQGYGAAQIQKPQQQQQQQQQRGQEPNSWQSQDNGYQKQNVQTSVKVSNQPGGNQQFNIFGGNDYGAPENNNKQYGGQYSGKQKAEVSGKNYGGGWGANEGQSQGQNQQQAYMAQQQKERRNDDGWNQGQQQNNGGYQKQQQQEGGNQYPPSRDQRDLYNNPINQGQQQNRGGQQYPPARDQGYQQPQGYGGGYQQQQQQPQSSADTFGQRVVSGNNSASQTGVSSIKLHQPPGGRSNFSLS